MVQVNQVVVLGAISVTISVVKDMVLKECV
jgi:hypothetical protein